MIVSSNYEPRFFINNGHVETVLPYFFRYLPPVDYQRERIETEDGDFLDLDWIKKNNNKLVILSHGLEGCSQSSYNIGMSWFLSKHGYDVLVWNHRGCSGEPNQLKTSYHSGFSQDLKFVISYVIDKYEYSNIDLVGFSMGGNITLKYLGEEADQVPTQINRAVAISTPVSLTDCSQALSKGISRIYTKNFIFRLVRKLEAKKKKFPDFDVNTKQLKRLWSFKKFDDRLTAPLYGFRNAEDYWEQSSSLPHLKNIKRHSLILNALNDPFLSGQCYPTELVKNLDYVHLETPRRGGHVGFPQKGLREFWSESRTLDFITQTQSGS